MLNNGFGMRYQKKMKVDHLAEYLEHFFYFFLYGFSEGFLEEKIKTITLLLI